MSSPRLSAIAASVLTLSCSLADEAHLYNNTGTAITVSGCGGAQQIRESESFKWDSVLWCKDPLRVSSAIGEWTYKTSPLRWSKYEDTNSEYAIRTGTGNYAVRFQLNRDGAVFVVPAKATAPVGADIRQPPGFPVTPDVRAS
jgi:hypothetical protein